MSKKFDNLPYRECVGIVLVNPDGLVWVGKRISKWTGDTSEHQWQMPQGGIDKGETPAQAAFRELEEETGTSSAEILAESSDWLTYDLPEDALGIALKGKYRGQKQKWFVMRFLGNDDDIDISERSGHKAEFSRWRWAPLDRVVDEVVPFKRNVYRKLAEEFVSLVR